VNIITVHNVSKTYKSYIKNDKVNFFKRQYTYTKALEDVSFTVDEGEILGLIGLNGAGKTSMIKLVSGIMRRDKGEIKVMGFDPFDRNLAYRKAASLVLGQNGQLDNDLTILDSVSFYSALYDVKKDDAMVRAKKMARELMLTEVDLQKQVRDLSLGQRMKGELILAFNHLPKVIYLDEPTLGLDFMAQKAIRNFLKTYVKDNKASMILTSHYGKDIEELCPNILVLYKGKSIYYGSLHINEYVEFIEGGLDTAIEDLYKEHQEYV